MRTVISRKDQINVEDKTNNNNHQDGHHQVEVEHVSKDTEPSGRDRYSVGGGWRYRK